VAWAGHRIATNREADNDHLTLEWAEKEHENGCRPAQA